jgi:hypothetical protein
MRSRVRRVIGLAVIILAVLLAVPTRGPALRKAPAYHPQAVAPPASPSPTPTQAPVIPSPPAAPEPLAHHVALGIYTPGFPGSMGAVSQVEDLVAQPAALVMWYEHWGGPWSAFNAIDVQAVVDRGSIPVITWMSDDPSAPGYPAVASQGAYTNRSIVAGQHDAYVRSWAQGLRNVRGTVVLRFDHEMNGNWYAWAPGAGGQTALDYVAAWRHVHTIFEAEGVANVQWMWSPNVAYSGSAPLASLYPGDAYVDRIGVDGYNWGTTVAWHTWQSFSQIFGSTLANLHQISNKPLMIAEVGSTEVGGNKAAWITDFFKTLAEDRSITGFISFDVNKETDWRINSSASSLAAFKAGLSSLR